MEIITNKNELSGIDHIPENNLSHDNGYYEIGVLDISAEGSIITSKIERCVDHPILSVYPELRSLLKHYQNKIL